MDALENSGIPMLRHAVAALAYRAAKTLRNAPPGFEQVRAAPTTRMAIEIVAHMGDLMEWSRRAADGQADWRQSQPGSWEKEVARFFAALKAFDDRLATRTPPASSTEKFLQGPVADAFTHVGQLATLRRMAGSGVRGESYFQAEITAGRVGMDQSPPAREFD
jgi:hypothetical protein